MATLIFLTPPQSGIPSAVDGTDDLIHRQTAVGIKPLTNAPRHLDTDKSKFLFDTFANSQGIEQVSGMGLMIGLKTSKPAKDVVNECMKNGVLCLTAKDRVRLLPALNIPDDLLAKAADVIKACCA